MNEEAAEATVAFQAALARIGVATIAEALAMWRRVNPARLEATANAWLDDAVNMILSRRGQSRELAVAYFRLFRALRTGKTVPDPRDPEPTYVTLKQLRAEFAELVESTFIEVDNGRTSSPNTGISDTFNPDGRPNGNDEIEVEFEYGDADAELAELERQIAEEEKAEREAAERELELLGRENLKNRVSDLDDDELSGKELDAARDAAHQQAGAQAAARAEREVLNAGRGEVNKRMRRDSRAIGWVRISKTGTPCYFCGVLISRGFVYFSEEKAGGANPAESDLYHDHCKCVAEPVYSKAGYESNPIYALNREYSKLYNDVFLPHYRKVVARRSDADKRRAAKVDNDLLNEWRKFLAARRRANPSAQEATAA